MKRSLLTFLTLALIFSMSLPGRQASAANGQSGTTLSKEARALLAEAVANGKSEVTILIASKKGANNRVANGLASLGARVDYREDDIDYLRAEIPVGQVEAAAQVVWCCPGRHSHIRSCSRTPRDSSPSPRECSRYRKTSLDM